MARSYECILCEHVQVVGVIPNGLSGYADPGATCDGCGAVGTFHHAPGHGETIDRLARELSVTLNRQ